jgi:1-deoxyxylulose-5-phosphate synthase
MQYVRLGRTGLEVSRLCLGGMSFGEPGRGEQPWTLAEPESRAIIRRALDAGINYFDTANVYSDGASEEIVGRALREMARREEVVVATKVWGRMRPGPNGQGLSRKALMTEIDESLRRLGMDYVDLYQIHRWDPGTPIEETMEALHDIVKSGKARYIGTSSIRAWQYAKALRAAETHGWTRFVSFMDQYNLLYREGEREVLPFCADEGIAVLCWSPLARGYLARAPGTATSRSETDRFGQTMYGGHEADDVIIAAVARVAAARGIPMARIALAWLLDKPQVTATVVGTGSVDHLDDAIAAMDVHLSPDETASLEEPYRPRVPFG